MIIVATMPSCSTDDALDARLATKVNAGDVYTTQEIDARLAGKANVSDVSSALADKAFVSAVYTRQQVDLLLADKANATEFYTRQQVDLLLAEKASATEFYTRQQIDAELAGKANVSAVYTRQQTDAALAGKANISDVYTRQQVDQLQAAKANLSETYTRAQTDVVVSTSKVKVAAMDYSNGIQAFTFTPERVMGLQQWFTTTSAGRLMATKAFTGGIGCNPGTAFVGFYLLVDNVSVPSSLVVMQGDLTMGSFTLVGVTDTSVAAGYHSLRLASECVGPATVDSWSELTRGAANILVLAD